MNARSLFCAVAATALLIGAGSAFAQFDDDHGYGEPEPALGAPEPDYGDQDPSYGAPEPMPGTPESESSSAPPPRSETPAAPKAGDGFDYLHAFGGRYSLGYVVDVELNLQIGLSQTNRLEFGANVGWGFSGDVIYLGYGVSAAYQWHFPLSPNGFMAWYAGPAATVGYYGALSTDIWADDASYGEGVVVGIGGQVGVEFNFGELIPPDKRRAFRYWQISIDARPVFNVVRPHKDLLFMPAIAIATRRQF